MNQQSVVMVTQNWWRFMTFISVTASRCTATAVHCTPNTRPSGIKVLSFVYDEEKQNRLSFGFQKWPQDTKHHTPAPNPQTFITRTRLSLSPLATAPRGVERTRTGGGCQLLMMLLMMMVLLLLLAAAAAAAEAAATVVSRPRCCRRKRRRPGGYASTRQMRYAITSQRRPLKQPHTPITQCSTQGALSNAPSPLRPFFCARCMQSSPLHRLQATHTFYPERFQHND